MNNKIHTTVLLAVILGGSLVSGAAFAHDYVRTMTCGSGTSILCRPDQVPLPLSWSTTCVNFQVSSVGSSQFLTETGESLPKEALRAVTSGFFAWNSVSTSSFHYEYGGLVPQNDSTEAHENAVFWRDHWGSDVPRALAVTTVNYLPSSGRIINATMEINTSSRFHVTFPPMMPSSDLQNTVTHEAGHFLGLAHTWVRDATMYGDSPVGELTKRKLKQVDKDGVSAIYPASYGAECASIDMSRSNALESSDSDSSCSSTGGDPSGIFGSLLIIVGMLAFGRRRTMRQI